MISEFITKIPQQITSSNNFINGNGNATEMT